MWNVIQSDYSKSYTGTSFNIDFKIGNQSIATKQMKLKLGRTTTIKKAQVKVYKSNDLNNPIFKSITDNELELDYKQNFDPNTGTITLNPEFFGLKNKIARVEINFAESITLLGHENGKYVYLETNDRVFEF